MGLWYYHSFVDDPIQKEIHTKLEEPHRLLHDTAFNIYNALVQHDMEYVKKERGILEKYYQQISIIFNEYLSFLEKKSLS